MNQTALPVGSKTIGKSNLDCAYFETLCLEAFRLIRQRKVNGTSGANGSGSAVREHAEGLKEVTSAAVNDRLSASRR